MAGVLGKLRYANGGPVGWGGPDPIIPGGTPPAGGGTGRTYTPLPSQADYYTYGRGPEATFFTGELPTLPLRSDGISIPKQPSGPSTSGFEGVVSGLSDLFGTAKVAGQLAQQAGYDNAFTQFLTNPWGSVKGWLGKGAAGGAGAAGAAAGEGALSLFGPGAVDLSTITGSQLFGSGAGALGADSALGSLTLEGLGGGASAAAPAASVPAAAAPAASSGTGAAASTGAGATNAMTALGPIALIGALSLYGDELIGGGDEARNLEAFQKAFPGTRALTLEEARDYLSSQGKNPGKLGGKIGAAYDTAYASDRSPAMNYWRLPDGRIVDGPTFKRLVGAWYGASAAPDGNQDYWQDEFTKELGLLYGDGHATGGPIGDGGGVLGKMAADPKFIGIVDGPGDGRSDSIKARLSKDEYVFDAESVALLGNGSPEAGAKKLDQFREKLRRQKGAKLAKGKFSDPAKDPTEYIGEE